MRDDSALCDVDNQSIIICSAGWPNNVLTFTYSCEAIPWPHFDDLMLRAPQLRADLVS
jgi:hypothetical protein